MYWLLLRAVLALKQSKTKVEDILQGEDLNLTFHGIGEFNNQVLYVKMLEEDQKMLIRIAGKYKTSFSSTCDKPVCRVHQLL